MPCTLPLSGAVTGLQSVIPGACPQFISEGCGHDKVQSTLPGLPTEVVSVGQSQQSDQIPTPPHQSVYWNYSHIDQGVPPVLSSDRYLL